MRPLYALFASICFIAGPAYAFDTTTAVLVRTSYISSQLTSIPFENKLIIAARDEAAGFVASNGRIRGARLEAALHWLRQVQPELTASDFELAQAILVQ